MKLRPTFKAAFALVAAISALSATSSVMAMNDFEAGKAYFAKRDYRSAKAFFDKAAVETPWDGNVLYYQALCAQYNRDWNGAKAGYKKLVEQFPGTDSAKNAASALNALEPGWEKKMKAQAGNSGSSSASSEQTNRTAAAAGAEVPVDVQAPPKSRIPVIRTGDKVYIDVAINGRQTRLEFAGEETTINLKDAQALQLLDKNKPAPSKLLVTMKTADITQKNFSLAIGGANDRSKIGEDYFKKFNYELDPSGITANYRLASTNKGGYDLPFRKSGKDLMVDITINGRRVSVAFDEKSAECIVPAGRAREFGLDVQEVSEADVYDPVKNPNGPLRGDTGYGEVKRASFAEGRVQMGPVNTSNIRFKVDDQATVARIGPGALGSWKADVDKAANVIHLNK